MGARKPGAVPRLFFKNRINYKLILRRKTPARSSSICRPRFAVSLRRSPYWNPHS